MRIGIDVSLLCQEKPTGVGLSSRFLLEALIRHYPGDIFVLTGMIPRAAEHMIDALPFSHASNVELKLLRVPRKVFDIIPVWWQWMRWPPIEWFVGRLDVFHSFDWFALPAVAVKTATVFDLTPLLFPDWHTPQNQAVFMNRLNAIRRYDHLFSISEATKKDVVTYSSDLSKKTSVTYLDTPLDLASQVDRKSSIRSGYLLFVGTLEPRKNLRRVLAAYIALLQKRKMPPLVLIGSFGWDQELRKIINAHKNEVIWLDYVPNHALAAWYRDALALVYPSLYEGFGIPVIEAMRCKTMVLTSQVSSMPEVAGNSAWYCDPTSTDSIGQAMEHVVDATAVERNRRVAAGLEWSRRFSYDCSAYKMHDEWSKCIKEKRL